MGRKKNGYIRQSYESDKPGMNGQDPFFPVYASQRHSQAFRKLTGNQRELYYFCREQQYNRAGKPPKDIYPDWEECKSDMAFFMNWGIVQSLGLYKTRYTFYKDLKALVDIGFIDCLYNGHRDRNKSIYIYSDKWRKFER